MRFEVFLSQKARQLSLIVMGMGILIGLAVGASAFAFYYGKGYSYLSKDPSACANCHIMQDYLDAWAKGSHKNVAVCNDCHMPHHPIYKWLSKADNGFWHSFAFATGRYKTPLTARPHNVQITENACRTCHAEIVSAMDGPHQDHDKTRCLNCHRQVGHFVRGK